MRTTIGDVVSRIRNLMKSVNQDAFLTDRFIYSVVLKHASWLLKREDGAYKLIKFRSAFETLEYVDLVEVNKIEASCSGLKSDCTIKRTELKLPIFLEGYWGPLISRVTSIDGSTELQPTTPTDYIKIANSKNFKYNTTNYYWYLNDYIYLPDVDWDAIMIEAICEGDTSKFKCPDCKSNIHCLPRQAQNFNVPDYLMGELESNVLKDMAVMVQYPEDDKPNKENQLR